MLNSKITTKVSRREYYEWPEAFLITRTAGGFASAIALRRAGPSCLHSTICGRRTVRDPQPTLVPALAAHLPELQMEAQSDVPEEEPWLV